MNTVDRTYLTDASGLEGTAERIFVPDSEQAVADLLMAASREPLL